VLLLRGLLIVVALVVWMYSVFDVIRSDAASVRYLHKLIWLVLVLLFTPIGPLAWLFLGRPVPLGSRLFEARPDIRKAPDDSPEFLAGLDDEIRRRRRAEQVRGAPSDPTEIEAEIRRLEEELRRRSAEEGGDDPPGL
jgi:hypothetical protein